MISTETLNELKDYLKALDQLLTGKSERECSGLSSQLDSIEQYLNGAEYYLSDGGYSRIVLDILGGRVALTSNSLDKVKANWGTPMVQAVLRSLNEHLRFIREVV